MSAFTVTIENKIAYVELNRPPVNSLLKSSYQEMAQVFNDLGKDNQADVAILKSTGNFFCPGNEVSEFLKIENSDAAHSYAQAVSDGISSIYNCEIPVIAAVHGHALGAGMAMAACADVVIAADDALFGIPEIKVGVIGAAMFLDLLVPEKVVRYMSLTGEPISSSEVAQYGGIHKITSANEVLAEAVKVAKTMQQNSPTALRYFKKAMNLNYDAKLVDKYATESEFSVKQLGSKDSKEAASAFLEKRKPVFN